MDNGVAAVAAADCNDPLEGTRRFVYVNAADNKILNTEARRLHPVKDRCGTSEAWLGA